MAFQKGQSGNPSGGKRERLITARIITELKDAGGQKLHQLVNVLIDKALAGDVPAMKEVLDRVEGKAPQPMEHEGEVEHVHYGARELLAREYTRLAAGSGSSRDVGEADGSAVH